MESDATAPPLSRTISLLAVVDTEHIKDTYAPSPDPLAPTVVKPGHLFMIGVGLRGGAGELRFKARVGDVVSMTGTSGYHNSNDAVIVYRVQPAARGQVFLRFKQSFTTREGAVQPDPDSASRDGLPALETTANFSSFESRIRAHGVERIDVDFALYTLSENGQRQVLFGYYRCELVVTVERPRSAEVA